METYLSTVDEVFHPEWAVEKLLSQRMLARSVAALWPDGHPTRLVQVAGTSGKGSTCRFIEAGMATWGTAGAYLSPHVFDYRERFSIDGTPAPADAVAAAWEDVVRPRCVDVYETGYRHPFSEVAILLALALFDRFGVALAAIETGLGGRYDQSTALQVTATAITNVGEDHHRFLGSEPWQRGLDKAGVARPGVPLFTTEQDPEVLDVIAGVAQAAGAPLHVVGPDAIDELDEIAGRHGLLAMAAQRRNGALALAVLRSLDPEADAERLVTAMGEVEFVGRLTTFDEGVLGDIAHNPDELAALVPEIRRSSPGGRPVVVVGVSGDRDPVQLLDPIMAVAAAVVVTESGYKGQPAAEVAEALREAYPAAAIHAVPDAREALEVARRHREGDELVVVTGSTYVLDAVFNSDPRIAHLNATMGWRKPAKEPGQGG